MGYNPHKPGRPSHVYHTYMISSLRLMLGVEVQPGNQNAATYTPPELWSFLKTLPREQKPKFLRDDRHFGNENIMREAEKVSLPYLFKLRYITNVKRFIQ